jgi:hypothetical protein
LISAVLGHDVASRRESSEQANATRQARAEAKAQTPTLRVLYLPKELAQPGRQKKRGMSK